jgi:hypothetical protein
VKLAKRPRSRISRTAVTYTVEVAVDVHLFRRTLRRNLICTNRKSMLKNEDLPPELRDEKTPPQVVEELPLEEPPDIPPESAAEPNAQTPPPADPYLRHS